MDQHVTEALAAELAKAVELIMSPMTPQQARLEAYMACERFKEESPMCAQVGLYLASTPHHDQQVRHFGLQLIEYTIKFKWNCITHEEKVYIKDNAIKMLNLGVGPAEDRTLLHLKDALSRIIVEMIKREWPQQWSDLLPELSQACSKGEAQTELVLLVFLRLVEDVALLQTIESNQRRKDMYQALNNNMNDIFEFFLRLVEQHVTTFRETTRLGHFDKANAHSRVVEVVLLTLSGFVEWVSINHIMSSNGKLMHFLCILLNDKAFQCNAAECLAQITNRKGQAKERKPLLQLYNEEPLRYIYSASQQQPDTSSTQSLEQQHNFLKKLLQVLNGMVQQLVALWGKDDATQRPAQLEIMFECLLLLVQHPSLTVAHGAALIWQLLLKHDGCSKDYLMVNYIPKLIHTLAPRIVKLPYPAPTTTTPAAAAAGTTTTSPRTVPTTDCYIRLEYDSEEEFAIYFFRCRTDFLEIFRQATLVQPLITYGYCESWLQSRLRHAHQEPELSNTSCSVMHPIYLEWEALASVLDGVLSRILLVTERPAVASGLRLLEECLKLETNNTLIYSILLSCISALFVFLSMSSCQLTPNNCVAMSGVSLLPRVLDKIFRALVVKPPNPQELVQQKSAKNLQRHAVSLLVKLAHKYPLLLLPVFDQINNHVECLLKSAAAAANQPNSSNISINNSNISSNSSNSSSPPLCRMIRTTLQEALILISNHFCDFERQQLFIEHIVAHKRTEWLHFGELLKTPMDFIHFVGLDKAPAYDLSNDATLMNRSRLLDALHVVLGVVKRCTWPDDPDRAQRGGFVIGCTELGNPICRNPATNNVVPLLQHVLSLMRVLNEMFRPEALAALAEGFRHIHGMLEQDKKLLMGICAVPVDPLDSTIKSEPTPFEKMQGFMTMIIEGCYHLMGSAGPSLGRDLYQLMGLSDAIINNVFSCLDIIPDYRVRPIIRVFFKPFVYSCPPCFYEPVLVPLFAHLTPLMCERLTRRWHYISALYESGQLNGEVNDTQEVLEDQLNRTLTREYLDVLKIALVGGQLGEHNAASGAGGGGSAQVVAMENEELSMDSAPQSRALQTALLSDIISELGGKLLRHNLIGNYMLMTLLKAIAWNDGMCSMKAVNIAAPVMRFLAAEQLMDENKAVSAFTAVLQGMQVHGQHEANQSGLITLGVQFYELLRPKFPILSEVLQHIPSVNAADIQKFDEKVSVAPVKGNKVDRAKKDIFKKLTAQLVGRSVNQLFRHEVQIANLPPMQKSVSSIHSKVSSTDFMDNNQNANLCSLFQRNEK
ncbi:exportin-5 [Drosophila busckii]|uniref:exportin-5 n=1 Tax=Drosophila busckii TaxID=30019 RepID=UPI001432892D|nr:exportin-5 [Drosophila busckii]